MRYDKRIERLKRLLTVRPRGDLLTFVMLCPVVGAGGRPLGLHPAGSPGSTAGVFVYDPSAGEPALPADRLAPHSRIVGGLIRTPSLNCWRPGTRSGRPT